MLVAPAAPAGTGQTRWPLATRLVFRFGCCIATLSIFHFVGFAGNYLYFASRHIGGDTVQMHLRRVDLNTLPLLRAR